MIFQKGQHVCYVSFYHHNLTITELKLSCLISWFLFLIWNSSSTRIGHLNQELCHYSYSILNRLVGIFLQYMNIFWQELILQEISVMEIFCTQEILYCYCCCHCFGRRFYLGDYKSWKVSSKRIHVHEKHFLHINRSDVLSDSSAFFGKSSLACTNTKLEGCSTSVSIIRRLQKNTSRFPTREVIFGECTKSVGGNFLRTRNSAGEI